MSKKCATNVNYHTKQMVPCIVLSFEDESSTACADNPRTPTRVHSGVLAIRYVIKRCEGITSLRSANCY